MKLDNIQRVYLIGIGGIGMSGLARYFNKRGCQVAGYDRTSTSLTESLVEEGIDVIFEDDVELIPSIFKSNSAATLVIYTPAVPGNAQILRFFTDSGFSVKKRSEVLGIISEGMFTIAVAGTHGKTTTSSMIAHILKDTGFDCSAFLGGIATNYGSNVLFGENDIVVIEADEYDRSFLTLHPDICVVTSMDADHLDIYGAKEQLTKSFELFVSQLKPDGQLVYHSGLDLKNGITYSATDSADVVADNIHIRDDAFVFNLKSQDHFISDLHLNLPGTHNVENAAAAVQVALLLGIPGGDIRTAISNYLGVKRRFEYIVKNRNHIYIDDYAHHPEELRACISAVKMLYPHKKLMTIFQPHLFTRTRDFADGFAEVLSMCDDLVMLDIYPARELPIEGVSSELILNKMDITGKQVYGKNEALKYVKDVKPELLLTVGAGDIDTLVQPLKKILENA